MSERMPRALARLVRRIPGLQRRADPAATVDAIAAVAERLAVLLSAGVSAPAAWAHVGEQSELPAGADGIVLAAAAAAAADGVSVAAAISTARSETPEASAEWSVLAAAWSVAADSGAPLAASLRDLATALRDEAQLRREVHAALAGPIASARLVMALPLIAVLFGAAFGFDTVAVLFGNPLGVACVLLGGGLLWAGRRWSTTLAARATRSRADAGLELELLAIAMSSGASIDRARALVADALAAGGERVSGDGAPDAVIALAVRAGAPVADLLRAESFRLRRVARADGAARAAALGVRLMLPLGACVLPAFVLLGVVPLLVSVVSGTLGGAA
jgi:tight adherence protein B